MGVAVIALALTRHWLAAAIVVGSRVVVMLLSRVLPASAAVMFVFGALVLFGGLAASISVALRHHRKRGKRKWDAPA